MLPRSRLLIIFDTIFPFLTPKGNTPLAMALQYSFYRQFLSVSSLPT